MNEHTRPGKRPTWTTVVTAAAAALLLGAGATWAVTAGPLSSGRAFTAKGSVAVTDGAVRSNPGTPCRLIGDFGDIRAGAEVVVSDGSGKTVALSKLATDDGTTGSANECIHHFSVPDVPGGLGIYGIDIAKRGRVQYTEAQIRAGVSLAIGR